MEKTMKTHAGVLLVPEFYVGKICQYDSFGIGEVRLVYSSRFEGIESTGSVGEILSSEDEIGFLESQIMGAVRFFEDTLGFFGKEQYVLYNGSAFRCGDEILAVPCFLEQRIQYELRDFASAEVVFRQIVATSTTLQ